MSYLTQPETIRQAIDDLTKYNLLWMDTEIADWQTPYPRLSLIQILANKCGNLKDTLYILDVLDKKDLINYFIQQIMVNSNIEKVFHNANFDVKYLGGNHQVKNVTCTLKIARKITKYKLSTPDLKLKTLAQCLCGFQVELNEQASDWGLRPLTDEQLEYARLDVIYLAKVHQYLLHFGEKKEMGIIEGISTILKNLGKGNKGSLYKATVDFIKKENLPFEEDIQESIITLFIERKELKWHAWCFIEEEKNQVIVISLLPVTIPPNKIPQVIDFLIPLQSQINCGHFGLDDDKTKIFFDTTVTIKNDSSQSQLFKKVFSENFGVVTASVPKIREIILEQSISIEQFNQLLGITPVTEKLAQDYYPIFLGIKEKTDTKTPPISNAHPETLPVTEEVKNTNPNSQTQQVTTENPISIPQELKPLSVEDIRLAYECPRLFYLVYLQGGERKFIADKELLETNILFNQVTSQLIDSLIKDDEYAQLFDLKASEINPSELTTKLKTLLYKKCFFPYIQNQPQKAPLLLKTWEAITPQLQKWTEILISNLQRYSPQELFKNTFINRKNLNHIFSLSNNQKQLIRGEFNNCLYQHHNHTLFIINHQTEKSVNPEAQLVQVALSSYLIKDSCKLELEKTTYLLFPDSQEFTYTCSQIEQTITQLISDPILTLQSWLAWEKDTPSVPPKTTYQELCNICLQQEKCQNFFTTKRDNTGKRPLIIIPTGKPIDTTITIDENMGKTLVSTLNAFGLKVEYLETIAAPSFYRIKIIPNPGIKTVSIINRSQDLQVQMGIIAPPVIQAQAGFVSVDIPRKDRQTAHFRQYILPKSSQGNEEFKIAIGVNLEGKLVEADLADPNTCHFLVGGTTGSGKSEFLRAVLLSLMDRHSPEFLRVAIVDPKLVTFPEFDNLPWLLKPVIKNVEDGLNLIVDLVEEMENRYQKLEKNKCSDIKTYNQKFDYASGKVLPRIVCVFDEYADFMGEKATREPLESGIKRLGAKARAAGIHLIIGTQRPDATVVNTLIRSNLPGRVALKTASESDSNIIFGSKEKAAAYLLGKGDLLYLKNGVTERLQSLFVEQVSFQ